eukprot:gene26148-34191_t
MILADEERDKLEVLLTKITALPLMTEMVTRFLSQFSASAEAHDIRIRLVCNAKEGKPYLNDEGKQAVAGKSPYAQVLKSSVTPIANFKSVLWLGQRGCGSSNLSNPAIDPLREGRPCLYPCSSGPGYRAGPGRVVCMMSEIRLCVRGRPRHATMSAALSPLADVDLTAQSMMTLDESARSMMMVMHDDDDVR